MTPKDIANIILLVLVAVGYVPAQALRTRRAAIIAGAIGILIIPAAFASLRLVPDPANNLWTIVAAIWISMVGYGVFAGAIIRYVFLGRPPMSQRQHWGMVAGGYAVFAILGWLAMSQLSAAL